MVAGVFVRGQPRACSIINGCCGGATRRYALLTVTLEGCGAKRTRAGIENERKRMGDAGEALIDAESRVQERMDEIEVGRTHARMGQRLSREQQEAIGSLESLRLAHTEMERQLEATSHEARRSQINLAIEELERRMAVVSASIA